MDPKLIITTALYYSTPYDIHGGRGWVFKYYDAQLISLCKLGHKVVIFHDRSFEQDLIAFKNQYQFDIDLIYHDLLDFPLSEEYFKLKKKHFDTLDFENASTTYSNNDRLYALCLAKPHLIEKTYKKYKDTEYVYWMDAGLFHHGIFPESVGGMEKFRMFPNRYWPEDKTNKFNPELGKKILQKIEDNPGKILGYVSDQINRLYWWSDVFSFEKIGHFVGGLIGTDRQSSKFLHEKFYENLKVSFDKGILCLEEEILSAVYCIYGSMFVTTHFATWYHDVPTDPAYVQIEGLYPFYRCFFDLFNENQELIPTIFPVIEPRFILEKDKYDLPNFFINGSHNGCVCVEYKNKILEVIEIERLLGIKNQGVYQYKTPYCRFMVLSHILDHLKNKYGFTEYGYCVHQNCVTIEGDEVLKLDLEYTHEPTDYSDNVYRVLYYKSVPAKEYIEGRHHISHAAGAFYQSSFKNALVLSFDGGGNDGWFKIFLAEREKGVMQIWDEKLDLGLAYASFGAYFKDINFEFDFNDGNLVYAGKILGLQSYGKCNEEWLPYFIEYYRSNPEGKTFNTMIHDIIGCKIGVLFDQKNRLEGQLQYDIARTSQEAFETLVFKFLDPYARRYPSLPICIAGGCALNIVLNTKIKERYETDVYIGPNPNDCGLAPGMALDYIKPQEPIDLTYSGIETLDKNLLPRFVEQYRGVPFDINEIVDDLVFGKIIGLMQGTSEHGPRALGNRSILCNPLINGMKELLNAKVKFREWFRPFAPVVRLEDVSKYFEWEGESRHMSFCPKVKEHYKDLFPAAVHIDGTARVQTVTREQNQFLYDILTLFAEKTGAGVLLNTSLNTKGGPIVSTYKDALTIYDDTQLDALYLDRYYLKKKF